MYLSGMDPALAMPFSITTIIISVPFALIVFAMITTLWGASIRCSAPADIYIHDTYFVVAHFHYTLISATFFGGFAGIYYWFPKMTGRMMNETLGKIHFGLTFIFFNLVFGAMHLVGVGGMMRRIADPTRYDFLQPLQPLNVFISVCAFLLLAGQIPFVINFFGSLLAGRKAEANPWQANTLEWHTASPPPHHNFDTVLTVHRGPYDYSAPGSAQDWLPQDRARIAGTATS